MKCDLDYINCQLSDDIEIYRNEVMIKIIEIYLNTIRENEHDCIDQVGGGYGEELAEVQIGDIDGVLGHFGSSIGKSVSSSIFNSTGDLIKNSIGAIVGILPGGGTMFELVSTVDEMSTIAMLQFINSFPIFFRSYLEFLNTLGGIDADLTLIREHDPTDPTDVTNYFNSIKEQFEIGNLAKSVAFGKQHRSHLGDTKSLLGAQFIEGSTTGAAKQQNGEDKARKGINEIVELVFNHVTSLNDDENMNFINRKVIEEIEERRNVNRLINCLTEWSVSAGSRSEWQTFSFQLQEYLDLRSSFQPNAYDSYGNAIRRSLLKASITTEKIFDQGILGSGVIMAFALYMINNIEVYKDLCVVSLIYWIHISKCILGTSFEPPTHPLNRSNGHPNLSGGFSCLNDFMKATEINDGVILAELNIYPQLLNIDYVNDVIKQVIITNMKFMSLCYRIFKVLDDINQRPFDSAIGVLQAFFEVGSNILDLVDGEISKTK